MADATDKARRETKSGLDYLGTQDFRAAPFFVANVDNFSYVIFATVFGVCKAADNLG